MRMGALLRPMRPAAATGLAAVMAAVWLAACGPAALGAAPARRIDKAADDFNMAAWLYASKKYEMAVEEFRRFIKKHPTHEKAPEARLSLGRALMHLKRYDEAAAEFQKLRQDVPKYDRMAEVLFELGRAEAARGRSAEAADLFGKVVDEHGSHYLAQWARAQRGSLLVNLKQYDEAEKALQPLVERFLTGRNAEKNLKGERERLAKISPAVAAAFGSLLEGAHLNLGLARLSAGKLEPARETLEEFLALSPQSDLAETARFNLAQTHYRRDDYGRAAEVYAQVAKGRGPYAADAAFEEALALYKAKKHKEAASAFAEAAKRFPQAERVGKAWLYAGMAAYLAEDYSGAARHLQQALKRDASGGEADYWLGMAYLQAGKPKEARQQLEQAVQRAKGAALAADAHVALADALFAEGEHEKAAETYRSFAEKYPRHAEVPRALYAAAAGFHRAEKYDESDKTAGTFLEDSKAAESEYAPQVLFISGENRFLQKKYDEAAKRYGALVSKHKDADAAPSAWFRLAWISYFGKEYDAAIKRIGEALKAQDAPFRAEARYLLGNCHFEKGDYKKAVETLGEYLKGDGERRYREDAEFKSALALARLDKTDDAVARLQQFLKDHEKAYLRPRAEYELAEMLRKGGKLDDAARHYERILEKHARDELAPYALYGLGACRFEQKKWDEAAEAFARIAKDYGDSSLVPQALYQQGLARQKAGKHDEARTAFQAMTSKYEKHELAPSAYLGLGVCLQKEKKFDEAAAAFRSLVKTTRDKTLRERARYELAWSLAEAGKAKEALEAYQEQVKEFPDGALATDAYFALAEAAYQDKDYAKATDWYEKALGAAKDDRLKDRILYRLGWCKWAAEAYEESASLFDRLAAECAKSDLVPEALFTSGEAYVKLKKPAQAVERFEKLLDEKFKGDEHRADARFRMGEAQLVLGRDKEAVETLTALEQAHEDYPAMAEVQFGIGRGLYNLKQHEQARARFERVTGMTDTETAAKAQFYVGETYLAEAQPREALRAYLRVVALWGGYTEWAAGAQFEIGKAYEMLEKPADAREAYQAVVTKYADTKWALPAKEQLEKLSG